MPTDGGRSIVENLVPDELLKKAGDKRAGKVVDSLDRGLYNAVVLKKVE